MKSADHPRKPFIQQQNASTGSRRLMGLIKSAYWFALLVIAAITMGSFTMLQQMMTAQQRDDALHALVSTQKALSQRVVFLAGVVNKAAQEEQFALIGSLRQAVSEFDDNQDVLVEAASEPWSSDQSEGATLEDVLYGAPHHLGLFATELAANGWRLVSALETELGVPGADYRAGKETAVLDETVANATLQGFTELSKRINALTDARLESTLKLHRALFYMTIGVIILIALFIFRPMSKMILRKTDELMEARNSMAFLAVHDGLTGLHNRAFLTDHFDTLIKGAQRRSERMAVVQIDLDRFKQINDTLGHAAGDYVLVATAQRMRESCRASDICVRLGGDEFVMILQGAGTTEDINMVAKRIIDRINDPIIFQGATIMPGASAGIAVYPVDADNAKDLMVHADLALYNAKKQGGGGFSFFSEELRLELEHRKMLEHDLRIAIEQKSFDVYFQPQVSLTTGSIAGVEALVRWKHEKRGMIPPGEFIPVAEKSGLMSDIGRIVMAKAIKAAGEWHRADLQFGRLAVNVSGTELREIDFDRFLFDTLEAEGLPAQKLSLEIVESVILDDEKTGIAAKLRHIRSAGVHLELDDFGTGYASLSHVNPNEIDRLKIDRRFVQNINANSDNTKIVRAITELARGLGISIIAEGAETEAELTSLKSIGCDQVQGYSIAFPMPTDQTEQWLTLRSPRKPHLTILQGSRA